MAKDKSKKIGKIVSHLLDTISKELAPHCGEDASQENIFACLMATQIISETMATRLRDMNVQEDLIEFAIENAKNQITFLVSEQNGHFFIGGEDEV